MIKIKPFYRIGRAPDVLFLMSEADVKRVPLELEPLLQQLLTGSLDPLSLSDAELEQLQMLDELGVIYNPSGERSEVANLFEISGWRESFVQEQLNYARIKLLDHHADPRYSLGLAQELLSLGVNLVDTDPTLNVAVVERLNQLDDLPTPTLVVKIGTYRSSVGPLICPTLTAPALKQVIDPTKLYFETESFLEELPSSTRALTIQLLAHEILGVIVKAGGHPAIQNIVEWDVTGPRRTVWAL